jgi:hypothetical protein
MRAKRKPVDASSPARAESQLEMVRLVLPPSAGKQAQVLGHGADAAPAALRRRRGRRRSWSWPRNVR